MSDIIYDVIIIGGGPSGLTAAIYSSRAGLKTLVAERYAPGGQMATTNRIDNYPGYPDGIDGAILSMNMKEQADKYGTDFIFSELVDFNFDREIKELKLADGSTYSAKTVIVASGAYPRPLGLDNEDKLRGKGVSYCATCDGAFFKEKNVIVVGGGDTAASDALFLENFCNKIYIIHRRNELRAQKSYQELISKSSKIEILWDSVVEEIISDDKVTGAIVKNNITGEKRKIDCEGIFIAVGNNPNSEIFKKVLQLDKNGYIMTDEKLFTGIKGIFACGDVREKAFRQIVTAAADGAVAAKGAEAYLLSIK